MCAHRISAGPADALKPGKTLRIKQPGVAILVANVDGEYYAVDDTCTHEDSSLYLGCLKGERVQCSLHGGMFNVKTGEAVVEPATIPLQTYGVTLDDGELWVILPEGTNT